MCWEAGILLTGIFLAEYYLIGRSVDRAIDRIKKRPFFRELEKIDESPALSKIVCDSLESLVEINRFVREDLPEVKDAIRGFSRAQKILKARPTKKE